MLIPKEVFNVRCPCPKQRCLQSMPGNAEEHASWLLLLHFQMEVMNAPGKYTE